MGQAYGNAFQRLTGIRRRLRMNYRHLNRYTTKELDQDIVVGNTEFLLQDFMYTEKGMVLISVKHQSLSSRSPFLGNLFAYDFETMIDGKPIALTGSNFTIISGIPKEDSIMYSPIALRIRRHGLPIFYSSTEGLRKCLKKWRFIFEHWMGQCVRFK
ncbi:hypothetical protein MGH68_14975 [Erysipelothrix sp. D19-032]